MQQDICVSRVAMFRRTGTSDNVPDLIVKLHQEFGAQVMVVGVYATLGKVIIDVVDWSTIQKFQKQYPTIFTLPLY